MNENRETKTECNAISHNRKSSAVVSNKKEKALWGYHQLRLTACHTLAITVVSSLASCPTLYCSFPYVHETRGVHLTSMSVWRLKFSIEFAMLPCLYTLLSFGIGTLSICARRTMPPVTGSCEPVPIR